ncbi:MAG: uridine kinase [Christensenellaceae bacterium]|jgi:uridine kinase|nr:uridine kinase [Christensenellaceae bacterium]
MDLYREIELALHARGRAVVAIDGESGAGKTTLAEALARRYDARVFHADDYFLQPRQRTPERLAEIGGNLDRERMLAEVILPVREGADAYVRAFDCAHETLSEARRVPPKPLTIVEGSYCLHPAFGAYYDIAVCIRCSAPLQRARLKARYDAARFARALAEWIPMENQYLSGFNIPQRCDVLLDANDIHKHGL